MLSYKQARQAIGQMFTISSDTLPALPLMLQTVSLYDRRNHASHLPEAFSMQFAGTRGQYCPQGIYRLENAMLGAMEVFIVPTGHDAETDEYTYQLIFN